MSSGIILESMAISPHKYDFHSTTCIQVAENRPVICMVNPLGARRVLYCTDNIIQYIDRNVNTLISELTITYAIQV